MKTISTCCGSHVRRKTETVKEPLIPNPVVKNGVNLIYVGSGNINLKGAGTGSVYHASDHSRHFRVYNEDKDSILRNQYIILKP